MISLHWAAPAAFNTSSRVASGLAALIFSSKVSLNRRVFWNTNAIFEKIDDEELSIQIAYAVNTVYKERNYSEDVL